MRIAIPHHTTQENARRIVETRMAELERQYGHYASSIRKEWEGHKLDFGFSARGMNANGTVEVTDSEVILDGKLPLLAKPFEPRIKSTIEREAETLFTRNA
jgi:hypothetical protein